MAWDNETVRRLGWLSKERKARKREVGDWRVEKGITGVEGSSPEERIALKSIPFRERGPDVVRANREEFVG